MSVKVKIEVKDDKQFKKLLKDANKYTLEVGYFADKRYEDGTYASQVAVSNEYGRPENNVPPRPFMRKTASKHSNDWKDFVQVRVNGKAEWRDILQDLGVMVEEDISDMIARWATPPNAPSTIKRKGFNDPLVDTGNMMLDFLDIRIKR